MPENEEMGGEEMEEIFEPGLFINTSYKEDIVRIGDVEVQLYALHSSATTDYDLTGQIIWPAAKLLSLYLTTHRDLCKNSSILELGAGAGLAGLVAAKLSEDPSKVMLTDNNDLVLDLLKQNININFCDSPSKPKCAMLSWGSENIEEFISLHGDYDLIIGADVVFWPAAVPLLFQTVHKLLTHHQSARFLLSYINRSNHTTRLLLQEAEANNLESIKLDISNDEIYSETLAAHNLSTDKACLVMFTVKQ